MDESNIQSLFDDIDGINWYSEGLNGLISGALTETAYIKWTDLQDVMERYGYEK